MRFIGSKQSLLGEIDRVLRQVCTGEEKVFCDLFSGTGVVAEYFKPRYQILSNDALYFSYVLQKAFLENNREPSFDGLKSQGIMDPYEYLLSAPVSEKDASFIYQNYAPALSSRRYFTPENALRIDFIRQKIQSWKDGGQITQEEYFCLLAALLEGIPYVSNTTGTYGAFLKHWDSRALSPLRLLPRKAVDNGRENLSFWEDANVLIKRLKGDILYLDPPYNNRQYLPNYHILETVSRWDFPPVKGVTGVRPYKAERSAYCSLKKAGGALEELIRYADFTHILLSYSSDGILSSEEIERILKRYGQPYTYRQYDFFRDKYHTRSGGKEVAEYLFYIRKKPFAQTVFLGNQGDQQLLLPESQLQKPREVIRSPLNYSGSKYRQLSQLLSFFPSSCRNFADLFCGSCSVSVNYPAQRVFCNDKNSRLIELYQALRQRDEEEILDQIDQRIRFYDLNKENEDGFHAFREAYNASPDPVDLYILTCFSFNYQFRFNSRMEYNNSFGRDRSHFTPRMRKDLIRFRHRLLQMDLSFSALDFEAFSLENFGPGDLIYCDPPYLSTTGSYNDGNRGYESWTVQDSLRLMDYLDRADAKGISFVMTNLLEGEGESNRFLAEWSKKYHTAPLKGSRGQLKESVIWNR